MAGAKIADGDRCRRALAGRVPGRWDGLRPLWCAMKPFGGFPASSVIGRKSGCAQWYVAGRGQQGSADDSRVQAAMLTDPARTLSPLSCHAGRLPAGRSRESSLTDAVVGPLTSKRSGCRRMDAYG